MTESDSTIVSREPFNYLDNINKKKKDREGSDGITGFLFRVYRIVPSLPEVLTLKDIET